MSNASQEVCFYDHAHQETRLEEELNDAKHNNFSFKLLSKVSTDERYEDQLNADK